jgi:hypothetical protein
MTRHHIDYGALNDLPVEGADHLRCQWAAMHCSEPRGRSRQARFASARQSRQPWDDPDESNAQDEPPGVGKVVLSEGKTSTIG